MTTPAVAAADPPDEALAAHFGDPLREQRNLHTAGGLVDRSNRPVLTVTGPDRLRWLHDITSQHLAALPAMTGSEALVLSPHGHVENHLVLADDGDTTWIDLEPGTAEPLLAYLDSMRFLLRVEVRDVTAEWAVHTLLGPAGVVPAGLPDLPSPSPGQPYPVVALPGGGGLARRMPASAEDLPVLDLLLPRGRRLDLAPPAGLWTYDALRVAAAQARFGIDTDARTIPQEVGWIPRAVHLDKGCYRGQETVARVHNLGRPPRRLVVLHLDGTAEALPERGSPVTVGGRQVGFVGTAARHHDLGPIALALVKRTVADGADVLAGDLVARIDPDLSLATAEPAVARERLRPR